MTGLKDFIESAIAESGGKLGSEVDSGDRRDALEGGGDTNTKSRLFAAKADAFFGAIARLEATDSLSFQQYRALKERQDLRSQFGIDGTTEVVHLRVAALLFNDKPAPSNPEFVRRAWDELGSRGARIEEQIDLWRNRTTTSVAGLNGIVVGAPAQAIHESLIDFTTVQPFLRGQDVTMRTIPQLPEAADEDGKVARNIWTSMFFQPRGKQWDGELSLTLEDDDFEFVYAENEEVPTGDQDRKTIWSVRKGLWVNCSTFGKFETPKKGEGGLYHQLAREGAWAWRMTPFSGYSGC